MKNLLYIISFLIFANVLFAGKKLENITIKSEGYFKIALYLSEITPFEIRQDNDILKINLIDCVVGDKFPGSRFSAQSDEFKELSLLKGSNGSLVLNLRISKDAEYICEQFTNSGIILISIFNQTKLNEVDKKYIKGLRYEIAGDKEKALIEYRKLLSNVPNHKDALYHAANIRKSLGYNYQTKANLSSALKSGLDLPEAYYNLSETYSLLGDENAAKIEMENFKQKIDLQKNKTFDNSFAKIEDINLSAVATDSSFIAGTGGDSSMVLAKSKPPERRIIRTIPSDTDSYYYSLAVNILIGIFAVLSIIYIIKVLLKKKNKKREYKKIDIKEITPAVTNPLFKNMVAGYQADFNNMEKDIRNKPVINKNRVITKSDNVVSNNVASNEIDKLARKYQVERGKIELAMKIIAKNDTETTKDKYLLLMKMLKENMSLEELASNLRIPKGELELVMNLKNF